VQRGGPDEVAQAALATPGQPAKAAALGHHAAARADLPRSCLGTRTLCRACTLVAPAGRGHHAGRPPASREGSGEAPGAAIARRGGERLRAGRECRAALRHRAHPG
jgi:hypothetical protein